MFIAVFFCPSAIDIGFTQELITILEEQRQLDTEIVKSRESEQRFQLQIELSTVSEELTLATRGIDFEIGGPEERNQTVVFRLMDPPQNMIFFSYRIIGDNTPENLEVFQLSVTPGPNSSFFSCSQPRCYQRLTIQIRDDDGELLLTT